MRLSELLPQPVRNIFQNYQHLKDPAITPESRIDTIQKISKDCFRLLLILPVAVYSHMLYQAAEKANSPLLVRLVLRIPCFAVSPAANLLHLAGLGAFVSVANLIHAIAIKSVLLAGFSVAFGLLAAYCSEKYECIGSDHPLNWEDSLIAPLSNQLARVFI